MSTENLRVLILDAKKNHFFKEKDQRMQEFHKILIKILLREKRKPIQ